MKIFILILEFLDGQIEFYTQELKKNKLNKLIMNVE